jgi:hypothetical protein
MAIFAAGVVPVVTVMADVAERTREASELLASAHSAGTRPTLAEGTLGTDSLTHLVDAAARIDVAGMVRPGLDPGEDLDGARQAIKRGVRVRRVFLIDTRDPGVDYEPYRRVGVEVRALHSDDFDFCSTAR